MARYSPTVDTSAYDQDGGGQLGQYLDYLRSKQYYDYATQEMQQRAELAAQDREMQLLDYDLTYPNLTYSPNGPPGYTSPDTYQAPVSSGPSMGQPQANLGMAIQDQMAEPGRPAILAGELMPQGGFAARNVYRATPEAPSPYEEVVPGLYRDVRPPDLSGQVAMYREALPGISDAMARLLAENPSAINSLPREMLTDESPLSRSIREAQESGPGREMDFLYREREREADQRRAIELEKLRQQGRAEPNTGQGSTSLTNDPEWRALDYVARQNNGRIPEDWAVNNGYPSASAAMRRWIHGSANRPQAAPESPYTTIQEIIEGGKQALEMFGPPTGRTTQPGTVRRR